MKTVAKAILSTRPVSESLTATAFENNIGLDALSFIETEAIESVEVQQEIEQAATQLATVVFTSMNAVVAVCSMLDEQVPEWRIYCIGHRTQELVILYFGETAVAGTADNAAELADQIIEDEAEEVFFFCGNKRRDEFPLKLQEHHILVNEVVVYHTKHLPQKIEKKYDAVLFFSPSAVESFFSLNQLPDTSVVYVIGNTTRNEAARYCSNRIIVSNAPAKDALVLRAIEDLGHKA